MIESFNKFAQFTKVEEAGDGNLVVYGVATLEAPDLDKEICVYEDAKPVYKAWSDAAEKRTKAAGQEISYGNIRLQHGASIGGKATQVIYDDANKRIMLGSIPINDEVADQLRQGFFTGYSQGGSYAYRKCSECDKNLGLGQGNNYCPDCRKNVIVNYGLKKLAEVSYVDSPCTGEGFDYVKADGAHQFVNFKRGASVETFKFAKNPYRGDFGGLDFSEPATGQDVAKIIFHDAPIAKVGYTPVPPEKFAFAPSCGDYGGL